MFVTSISGPAAFLSRRLCALFLAFATMSFFLADTSLAHRPDRCFHTHSGGNTSCNRGVRGKSCSDKDGNKGTCRQTSRYCYCSIHKSNDSTKALIELGIGVGGLLLDEKRDKNRRRHRREEDRWRKED